MKAYIAGPMRNYPQWNFPAFDSAALMLRQRGWEIISPAELDREMGFTQWTTTLPDGFMEGAMRRDIDALLMVDSIILLPGWEASTGAQFELTVARALGLDQFCFVPDFSRHGWHLETIDPNPGFEEETILEEANRLIYGDRNEAYGHPADDFARTGRMWGAILGTADIAPELVGLCMVAVKISREVHAPKRDNRTDGAGYFGCVDKVHQRRAAS
jgi:hypothetical protein